MACQRSGRHGIYTLHHNISNNLTSYAVPLAIVSENITPYMQYSVNGSGPGHCLVILIFAQAHSQSDVMSKLVGHEVLGASGDLGNTCSTVDVKCTQHTFSRETAAFHISEC